MFFCIFFEVVLLIVLFHHLTFLNVVSFYCHQTFVVSAVTDMYLCVLLFLHLTHQFCFLYDSCMLRAPQFLMREYSK